MQTIREMIENTVTAYPDKPAIIYKNKKITYQELNNIIHRLVCGFSRLGFQKGDWVMELIPNSPEIIFTHLALIKLGAVAVPLNVMYKFHEIEYIGNVTNAKGIVAQADLWKTLADEVMAGLPSLQTVVSIGEDISGAVNFAQLSMDTTSKLPTIKPKLDDIASVIFTSGTTGRPKGATQTHRSILSAVDGCLIQNKHSQKDIFLCGLPIFNNFGLNMVMMPCFAIGGTLVIIDRFEQQAVMDSIQQNKATYFAGTPTMFAYMLDAYSPGKNDLSSLRVTNSGGAHCAPELIKNIENTFGVVHLDGYGQTEACGFSTLNPVVGVRKPNSVGVPLSNTWIKIVDSADNELPAGEVGEVVEKGDVFSIHGYWNQPDANRDVYKNGWYHSGDLGYLDDDGYLYVVDRKQDLIITGGYNIYPTEVEDVLCSHPKVTLAAVIGIPDEVKGELAKAFILLKEGETATEQEIIEYVRTRMAKFKAPRIVEFVDQLPLGPTGKLLKRKLKEEILNDLKA
ncbi:class I adenylate-forming enzyme family protein [Desulfotignum balticum]|uniref:class I adenylate-forming enzyme family protein n=1 Tax=Desulfotignum balticum TaxID=115781 RepID=UPI000422F70E|nr:AMP-binding protein [Desulfotignum balticum]